MGLSDFVLYQVARRWPSPMADKTRDFGAEPGTEAYARAYAHYQFNQKVWSGLGPAGNGVKIRGCDVLEIGTGHGGIACYFACIGAKRVVGIDIDEYRLSFARNLAQNFLEHDQNNGNGAGPRRLPVEFLRMSADQLELADAQFDIVLADNLFEHVMEPEAVMREAFRVLRPGGVLLVPLFSTLRCKYGLHLKHGIRLPWTNLVFSERTIIRAVLRMAKDDPQLFEIYPGLRNNPQRIRDVRLHGDLNDISFKSFKEMATRTGFKVEQFQPRAIPSGKVLGRLPGVRRTPLAEILSIGASARLRKPQ